VLFGQERFPNPPPARSTIQALACRQLPSPKLTKKSFANLTGPKIMSLSS